MLPYCLYGESYEEDSTGCNIVDEKNKLIYVLEQENTNLKQALNEIRKYINTAKITKDGVFLVKESTWGQEVLQIIDKYTKERK